LKQTEYIGSNSISKLPSILKQTATERLLVVTGKKSYISSGAQEKLEPYLNGCKIVRFSDFNPNPKIEDIQKALKTLKQAKWDAVIAVGGGSVIDTAKLINFFRENDIEPTDYIKTKRAAYKKPKPLVAIPTTAGSGSEATSFAVLYVGKQKYSIEHETLLPEVAIVDPTLTYSVPKYITACTAMDALSQAIESYWCVSSNNESKTYSRHSIGLILSNIENAVNQPDESTRQAMSNAAHLAGKAINITKTTAPHAISYPLTSFFQIAHGHAVALTLPLFLEYNANVTDQDVLDVRGSEYVRKTINEIVVFVGGEGIDDAKQRIRHLTSKIGLETRLSRLGVKSKEDIETIVANGFNPGRIKNNPRLLTEDILRDMLCNLR